MKKIALIMEGWKRFFTYAWPSGILERIKETQEEVNLYIFNSSGVWSLDEAYNVGEYNIHHLPDLTQFDGVILDINNISDQSVCDYIINKAAKSGKPVISIANEIKDFYYVGIDNEKAIREIISHLYEKHGCRRYWFVMAGRENYENRLRVQALKTFMQEHDIAWSEADFYYGNYESKCGITGFEQLRATHGDMPDAVICANDNIAVGVCQAAELAGYKIPEDFCVTGFDDFDKAAYYTPSITTVSHVREEVGYVCADTLLKIWTGQDVDRFNYTKTQCVIGESCGCIDERPVDRRQHAKEQLIYEIETGNFEDQVIALEYELIQCKSVQEMINWIPKCIPAFQCDAMYLILDSRLNSFKEQVLEAEDTLPEVDEFMISGYPQKMNVEFAFENGKKVEGEPRQIEGLFPMFDFQKGGTDFLFLPLHFRDKTVGYFVIRNAVYLMEKQYLFKVVNVLTSAMENLHKKEKLEYLNQRLTALYVKDAMTGIYNRMGYEKYVCRMFEDMKAKQENFMILFIDMDRLKFINDNFGHEYGDIAIKIIAQAISDFCPKEAIPVRMGGDEFLVALPQTREQEIEELIQKIRTEINDNVKKLSLPFEVSVSVGSIMTDVTSEKTLDDYIRNADEVMYREKADKKVQRG